MLQTFCYEMIVTCLDKEDSQLQVSPALRLIVLPLFFPPKWNLELESLWTLYLVQYVNTPHSYTYNSSASKLSGLVIRPNNWIHYRMRSIIDHLKQSRNFPRLRIGTAIICFLSFSSRRMSEILFPKTVVQALDGHLRRWVLSVLFWGHSATKKRKRFVILMHANLIEHYAFFL